MMRKITHPCGARTHDLSIIYRVLFIVIMSQIIKAMHLKYISIYQGSNQEIVYENDQNMNSRCPMTAVLTFMICGKTVPFTAWHTTEMGSAQKIHMLMISIINNVIYSHRESVKIWYSFMKMRCSGHKSYVLETILICSTALLVGLPVYYEGLLWLMSWLPYLFNDCQNMLSSSMLEIWSEIRVTHDHSVSYWEHIVYKCVNKNM